MTGVDLFQFLDAVCLLTAVILLTPRRSMAFRLLICLLLAAWMVIEVKTR